MGCSEIWVAPAPAGGCRFQFTIPHLFKYILDHQHEVHFDIRGQTTSLDVVNTVPPWDGLRLCGGNSGRDGSARGEKARGRRASLDGVSSDAPGNRLGGKSI